MHTTTMLGGAQADCASGNYLVTLEERREPTSVSPDLGQPARESDSASTTQDHKTRTTHSGKSDEPSSTMASMDMSTSVLPFPTSKTATRPTSMVSSTSASSSMGTSMSMSTSTIMSAPIPGNSTAASAVPPVPSESGKPDNSAVPLAVGISIGGAAIIGACVLGYFIWRRRRGGSSLARAETPPPRDTPDGYLDPVYTESVFRGGSYARRHSIDAASALTGLAPTVPDATAGVAGTKEPSTHEAPAMPMPPATADPMHSDMHSDMHSAMHSDISAMHSGTTTGMNAVMDPEMDPMTAVERANSVRTNSLLSSYNGGSVHSRHGHGSVGSRHGHGHGHGSVGSRHGRSASQDRFTLDAVAMHDMTRTPPAVYGYPRPRPAEPVESIPEIPFDGRRMSVFTEIPVMNRHGFFELPG